MIAVVDLGFGDAGKGLLVDWLVRTTGARQVVRFNGGAQAGHNVVTADGRHHCFAQFGAGTFVPGVETILGPEVVVHPTALLAEVAALANAGVLDPLERIHVHPDCPVVTPWHQALNRIRARRNGHGSCGIGVGEVAREVEAGVVLRMGELDAVGLRDRLEWLRERLHGQALSLDAASSELEAFHPAVTSRWMAALPPLFPRIHESTLDPDAILEGAQGVLLDQRFGFHPHTTWSDCTFGGAERLRDRFAPGIPIERIGVHRAFHVRHGPGPLPTENPEISVAEHNARNPWQGSVRYGWLDLRLLRYALTAVGGVDQLALTWLDAVAGWGRVTVGDGADLPIPADLAAAEHVGRSLVAPSLRHLAPDDLVPAIEASTGVPVSIQGWGPTADTVRRTPTGAIS